MRMLRQMIVKKNVTELSVTSFSEAYI